MGVLDHLGLYDEAPKGVSAMSSSLPWRWVGRSQPPPRQSVQFGVPGKAQSADGAQTKRSRH
jgi:hypothetical protein